MRKTRRNFFQSIAALAGASVSRPARSETMRADDPTQRAQEALEIRQRTAQHQSQTPSAPHPDNGDEVNLPNYVASFTKGLPHNQLGEVDPDAYKSLLYALSAGRYADFEAIQRGSGMKFVNPQSAFAFQLEGSDSHRFGIPTAPNFSSAEAAAEMVELYWQALTRDVPFTQYKDSPLAQAAIQDLNRLSAFRGAVPGQPVSTDTLFRGGVLGALTGPYVSQFLWQPIPTLSTWIDQKYRVPVPGIDYLTEFPEWLVLQTGVPPFRDPQFDPALRYVHDGRSLAEWVHYDFLYQGFHNAALILLNQAPETILNKNQYWSPTNPYKLSKVETGFGTFGAPHICSLLGHVTTSALCAAWFQKWLIHRRVRPEAFSGRVHQTKVGTAPYPIHADLLNSAVLAAVKSRTGSYLLPQAYPEGCPLHPAYPAGHATVSGACSALLKAFFDENALMTDCVIASDDGLTLRPWDGEPLLVGGEVNKLAFNIAMGRNFAGIHYRSDAEAGFKLGEDVAISVLQDVIWTLTEDFPGFQFSRLDGSPVTITKETAKD